MMKRIALIMSAAACFFLFGCSDNNINEYYSAVSSEVFTEENTSYQTESVTAFSSEATSEEHDQKEYNYGMLSSPDDINLHDTNGEGTDYVFTYCGEEFNAVYEPDIWHIKDSYRIDKYSDIVIICRALSNVHPIHSADLEGYRTAEDMAYEWYQHNLAYYILPSDSKLKENAKNVDIDPDDQDKGMLEIFMERTGC